jgi:hypothetical protein
MAQKSIGQGPGNLFADTETKMFLANAAITAGQVVSLTFDKGAQSYYIDPADYDVASAAQSVVAGVAKDSIAAGAWGEVYVSGYCPYVLTDGGVAAGDPLVAHTVAGEADTFADGEEEQVFGYALSTDTGTVEYCDCIIIKRF